MSRAYAAIIILTSFIGPTVSAHPGRTDASGGHHDRKSGGYHYHGGGGGGTNSGSVFASPVTVFPTRPLSINYIPKPRKRLSPEQIQARTQARLSARTTSAATRIVEKIVEEKVDSEFLFHMTSDNPRPVDDFEDNDKYWLVIKPSKEKANIFKRMVVRIEPTKDLKERRTWIDSTGAYSTVARFVRVEGTVVVLSNLEDEEFTVDQSRLSDVDQKHVARINRK